MTARNFRLIQINDKSSNRAAHGGDTQPGSHGAHGTQRTNIMFLPRAPFRQTSAPSNSELPLGAPLSFDDHDRVAGIALTFALFILLLFAGLMVFAGDLLFGFFDLG